MLFVFTHKLSNILNPCANFSWINVGILGFFIGETNPLRATVAIWQLNISTVWRSGKVEKYIYIKGSVSKVDGAPKSGLFQRDLQPNFLEKIYVKTNKIEFLDFFLSNFQRERGSFKKNKAKSLWFYAPVK